MFKHEQFTESYYGGVAMNYILSEQAFLDVWNAFGNPAELTEKDSIVAFFQELITATNGQFIVDHITMGNYDHLVKVEYNKPYFLFHWFDNEQLRQKALAHKLNEMEKIEYMVFGCAVKDYILMTIEKLVFLLLGGNHLVIIVSPVLTKLNIFEKWLKRNDYSIIRKEDDHHFETCYSLWEGNPEHLKKHIARVNVLPFATLLLQPKENSGTCYDSQKILIQYNYNLTLQRLQEAIKKLDCVQSQDDLMDVVNRLRRITENFCKYFCALKTIDVKLTEQYGVQHLGIIRKGIEKRYPQFGLTNSLVSKLNTDSHDNGIPTDKQTVIQLAKEVMDLIINAKKNGLLQQYDEIENTLTEQKLQNITEDCQKTLDSFLNK